MVLLETTSIKHVVELNLTSRNDIWGNDDGYVPLMVGLQRKKTKSFGYSSLQSEILIRYLAITAKLWTCGKIK